MNLLRASRIITFEPPPGVKANLLRTFSAVSSTRMSKVHYVHTCAVCRGHTPTWSSFLCRSLPNVLACTSSWLGSMPWSKRGFTTVHWAGPRNTSLMSQTSGWPVTHWTLGWIWCLRLVWSLADVLWNIQMYMCKVMAIGSSNCCFGVSHSILSGPVQRAS